MRFYLSLLLGLLVLTAGCGDPAPPEARTFTADDLRDADIPSYEIAEDTSHEAPGIAQVSKRIIVSETVSEASLRALLVQLYSEALTVSDWEYHEGPTRIAFYVYSSYVPEMNTNWLGMVFKGPSDSFVDFGSDADAIHEHNRRAGGS